MRGLVPYLYIAPAFAVTIVFSFVSMGISFWASLHHYDAFAGAAVTLDGQEGCVACIKPAVLLSGPAVAAGSVRALAPGKAS